jgi:hypothetical protein
MDHNDQAPLFKRLERALDVVSMGAVARTCYIALMDTTPTIPQGWERDLDKSRADLTAGRVVDGRAMRERLRASIGAAEPPKPEDKAPSPLHR